MDEHLTIKELEERWEKVLTLTRSAVTRHPDAYRMLKSLAGEIVDQPLDIREYLPAAEKLTQLLRKMDPEGQGTIFCYFDKRIAPSQIWQVPMLRVECRDLLCHLKAFDQWRLKRSHLKVIK